MNRLYRRAVSHVCLSFALSGACSRAACYGLVLLLSVLSFYGLRPIAPDESLQQGGNTDAQVKAAYLYNFSRFTYWDNGYGKHALDTVKIVVAGSDGVSAVLEKFARDQKNHPVLRLKLPAELVFCNILYICKAEQRQLNALLQKTAGMGILTVSDIPGFARKGGMIGFIYENGKIFIEINIANARKAGISINAKLLEVAREVIYD